MAEKRMFAQQIVNSDAFIEMPLSAQALYFHLSMKADDDGFINNPKTIQRMVGADDDDLNVLMEKNFVICFDSGVLVIKHWRINNYIRGDRKKTTAYSEEMALLTCKDNGAYTLNESLCQSNVRQVTVKCPSSDCQMSGKCQATDGIDKNSIDKNSIEEKEVQEKEEEIGIPTIYDFIESEFGRPLSPTEYEYISKWEDNDLTRYAVKQAVLNNAPRLKYIQAILNNYRAKNIKTVQDAQNDEKNFKKTGVPEWFGKEFQKEEIDPVEEAKLKNELQKVINGGN